MTFAMIPPKGEKGPKNLFQGLIWLQKSIATIKFCDPCYSNQLFFLSECNFFFGAKHVFPLFNLPFNSFIKSCTSTCSKF